MHAAVCRQCRQQLLKHTGKHTSAKSRRAETAAFAPHYCGRLSARWGRVAMHEVAALLATLTHIAGEPCSCDELSSRAVALVKTYSAALYERLGIPGSNRPTSSAKSLADQTLAELRRQILAVEARSCEPSRTAFTAARHRIEMARRVLATRLVENCEPPLLSLDRTAAQHHPRGKPAPPQLDWLILASLRRSSGREQVARSRAAIADSLRPLAACRMERSASLGGGEVIAVCRAPASAGAAAS